MAGEPVYTSGPEEEQTAGAAALAEVGIKDPKDIGKVFSSVEVTELTNKLKEMTLTDPSGRLQALKDHAEDQAKILGEAYQNRSKIRALRREDDLPAEMFAKEEANAQAIIDLLEDPDTGNIFAARINKKRADARFQERRNERIAERQTREKGLFDKATEGFTIHMASDGKEDGEYALIYHPQIIGEDGPVQRLDKDRKPMFTRSGEPIIATKTHVVLLGCSGGKARVIDCTQRSVIERMGDKRVVLTPEEDFGTPRGEPYFVLPIRQALVGRYKAEGFNAQRQEMTDKREISFTEGATKKGVAVAHWPPKNPYTSGQRRGPLSVVISFTGRGNFTLDEILSSSFEEFLAPAVGERFSLELPTEPVAPEAPADDADEDTQTAYKTAVEAFETARIALKPHKFLVTLINRRKKFEEWMSSREAQEAETEELVEAGGAPEVAEAEA